MTGQHKKPHFNFKGDNVGYSGVHLWLYKYYGNASKCSFVGMGCTEKSKSYQWANISHEYKRDRSDFMEMCRSCHAKFDCTEYKRERMRKLTKGITPPNARSVSQYSKKGQFIKKYKTLAEAAKELGMVRTSISNALSGSAKTAGGFIWR